MPRFEPRITLGNVAIFLQILLMGWGAIAAYTSLSNAVVEANTQVEDHEIRIRSLEAMTLDKLGRIEQRLISIEDKVK